MLEELRSIFLYGTRKLRSLNVALITTLAIGLFFASVAYLAIDVISTAVINEYYLSEDAKAKRLDSYAEKLQEYVDEEGVTLPDDEEVFDGWEKVNKYVYIAVYTEEQISQIEMRDTGDEKYDDYAKEHGLYVINLVDGERIYVLIRDHSENFYFEMFNLIEVVSAMVVIFSIMLVHIQGVTMRIKKLAREVGQVSGGDTEKNISIPGRDEICDLANSVDQMRVSILTKIESERAAIEANSQLITSMSHDIRTPLTVLLGYIDMMKDRAKDDPTMTEYVLASEKTALRLKRLSDDMFSYFLLFGKGAEDINLSEYDFAVLIEQMLSEYVLLLEEREYTLRTEYDFGDAEARISTDPDLLMRVVENVFSNIFKYADKAGEIYIAASVKDGVCRLVFENRIDRSGQKVETNGIGLKSCRKIAETLGIGFTSCEDGDLYKTEIVMNCV